MDGGREGGREGRREGRREGGQKGEGGGGEGGREGGREGGSTGKGFHRPLENLCLRARHFRFEREQILHSLSPPPVGYTEPRSSSPFLPQAVAVEDERDYRDFWRTLIGPVRGLTPVP